MDRFVWFVLLVVISHLVTEFTRVTSYTRGPRPDVVMVNDSSIQPIKVQNLVLYPGQEYGPYALQNQQYYNGNNLYNNYGNSNEKQNTNNSNLLNKFLNQFTNNSRKGQKQQQSASGNSNLLSAQSNQGDQVRTFNFRPIIDSIFEIPISTLRAVSMLLTRLTGGYFLPQQQLQHDQQQQPYNYYSYPASSASGSPSSYYGIQKSGGPSQPKTQFEMLNRIRQTTKTPTAIAAHRTPPYGAATRKSFLNGGDVVVLEH